MPTVQPAQSKDSSFSRYLYFGILLSSLGILIWQLSELSPSKYCSITKIVDANSYSTCAQLLMKIIDVKGYTGYGLIGVIFALTLVLGVREFKIHAEAKGPGDTGINIGNDPVPVEVTNKEPIDVTTTK